MNVQDTRIHETQYTDTFQALCRFQVERCNEALHKHMYTHMNTYTQTDAQTHNKHIHAHDSNDKQAHTGEHMQTQRAQTEDTQVHTNTKNNHEHTPPIPATHKHSRNPSKYSNANSIKQIHQIDRMAPQSATFAEQPTVVLSETLVPRAILDWVWPQSGEADQQH